MTGPKTKPTQNGHGEAKDAKQYIFHVREIITQIPKPLMAFCTDFKPSFTVPEAYHDHPFCPCGNCGRILGAHIDYVTELSSGEHFAGSIKPLTNKEQEVLEALAEGMAIKEIAKAKYLAMSTVKSHMQSVYDKLGTHNRVATINKARNLGLI